MASVQGGATKLFRVTGTGSKTEIGSSTAAANLTTDRLRVWANGTDIRVYLNGGQIIQTTSTNYTTGQLGLGFLLTAGSTDVNVADNYAEGY